MTGLAFCFPGQGSQRLGMFEAYAGLPPVAQALDEAGAALGEDLGAAAQDQRALDDTVNAQPLLLAIGVGVYRAWLERGGTPPQVLAGHSLGEFTAVVAAGCLGFADAVRLVRKRAQAMREAVAAGMMSAVLGLEREQVDAICAKAGRQAWPANYNAPGQVVLAGLRADVEQVAAACKAAGAKRVIALPVSVPSHCPLMQPAADRLAAALGELGVGDAKLPIVQNVTARPTTDAAEISANLVRQLTQPVDWIGCASQLGDADQVIECGPTKVLHGLNRRILPAEKCKALDSAAALTALLA